jgi:HKD family nuclease
MKVEAIPNKGPARMGPEIEHSLSWAEQVDIASAFVTPAALTRLKSALAQAQKDSRPLKIRLVFGLYRRFTPPQALTKMRQLRRAFPGKFFVRIARNNRFHWKLYIFRCGNSRRLYVGSANFTEDGLDASGELSVKITAKASDSIARLLEDEFDALWQNETLLLSKKVSNLYQEVERPPKEIIFPQRDDAISDLLQEAERPLAPSPTSPKPRLIFVDKDVSEETKDIISAETQWDAKGWDYTCYAYRQAYDRARNAKVILLVRFDSPKECWLEFRRVEEAVEIETPDGKYFIAHSRVPHGWCRKYEEIKQDLIQVGLALEASTSDRNLSAKQAEILCRLLHIKPQRLYGDQ